MQEADMIRIEGASFVKPDDGLTRYEQADKIIGNICRLIGELEGNIDLAEIGGSVAYVDAREIRDALCRAIWHEERIDEFKKEVSNGEKNDISDR